MPLARAWAMARGLWAMLKSFDDIAASIRRRFERTWADVASGATCDAWPYAFSLGKPSQAELARNAAVVVEEIEALRDSCARYGCILETEPRRLGAVQDIPARVVVPSVDVAAHVLGTDARKRLERARRRVGELGVMFPQLSAEDRSSVVKRVDAWDDVDVELLLSAGAWFAQNDARGLTPRQVPLDGFHAKWLDASGRQALVCLLAGKEDLGLATRPRELSLSYLDPAHLGAGGRRYDVCVEGDAWEPAYAPSVVLIVENKDSYLLFPQVEGGICVFGAGKAGPAICRAHDWIARAERLFYWGDMDADGLEILNAYRAAGSAVESILMDIDSFNRYERFGTRMAAGKRSLEDHARVDVPWLEAGEMRLYDLLCDRSWRGALRVEQERIPLDAAQAELQRKLG